jgi:hypothetical protein
MAAFFDDSCHDAFLNVIKNGATRFDICSSQPLTYANIATYTLGNKTGLTSGSYTGPQDRSTTGRELVVNAISGGSVTSNGTAAYACLSNGSDTLYWSGALSASQGVTSGNTFSVTAFDLYVLDPT